MRGTGLRGEGDETPLRAWCEATDTSPFAVSKGLDIAYSAVWKWFKGVTLPSLVMALKLEQWTEGGVPTVAWLGTNLAKAQWGKDPVPGQPAGPPRSGTKDFSDPRFDE